LKPGNVIRIITGWPYEDETKTKKPLEEHIDAMVVAEAEEPSAWSKPVKVRRSKAASVSLRSLAARAAFCQAAPRESPERLAQAHHRGAVDLEEGLLPGSSGNLSPAQEKV
jgi:hypothetical protein